MNIEGQGHFNLVFFKVLYICVYTRPRYKVSVHMTIGPLVFNAINISGYFVAWTIYTSQTDKFAPKHTIFFTSRQCAYQSYFGYFLV